MPPNFVHSLDSTHMMMTALRCHQYALGMGAEGYQVMDVLVYDFCPTRAGIPFVAVHDSFWTHACFVDEMNKVRGGLGLCLRPLNLHFGTDLSGAVCGPA